ncbi:MAG: hypothetical protein JWO42_1670 [Chloroflexi bacterium]|nr:hypothetical protein [Chloroflexota bacterium]
MGEIEQIVLRHDRRGMAKLAIAQPAHAYRDAATFLLTRYQRVMILTGFYVNGTIETDGPLGALAIAHAIETLGGRPTVVSDRYAIPILRQVAPGIDLEELAICERAESDRAVGALLARIQPTLVISVERCGETARGRYLNMYGVDISPFTARLDSLVSAAPSMAIGDGGNEIGMGNLATRLHDELGLAEPCHTSVDHLLLSAVSNWGAYGLLAALQQQTAVELTPSSGSQHEMLVHLAQAGVVDGVTGKAEPSVDSFGPAYHRVILDDLRAVAAKPCSG